VNAGAEGTQKPDDIAGLGGWLSLVGVGLFIRTIQTVGLALNSKVSSHNQFLFGAFAVGLICLNFLFYSKKRFFPPCFIIYLLVSVADTLYPRPSSALVPNIVGAIIWIWYAVLSDRVKATFTR